MKRKVLFLCTGNSARSQMAEVLLRHLAGEHFDAFSAGTAPEQVDPRTIQALEDFVFSAEGLHSKSLGDLGDQFFDFVISLCDKATQECKNFPNASEMMAWDFEDPRSRSGLKPFEITLREINERIKMFVLVQTK